MTVIDPFAGIGGFAYHAMKHGLNFRGVELEDKFVELAQETYACPGFDKDFWRRYQGRTEYIGLLRQERALCPSCGTALTPQAKLDRHTGKVKERRIPEQTAHVYRGNLPLWQHRYGGKLPNYGTARIVQGDSRRLCEVLAAADCVATSPPYAAGGVQKGTELHPERIAGSQSGMGNYPDSPAQLGNLREGSVDAEITSPPFEKNNTQLGGEQGRGWYSGKDLSQPMNRLKNDYAVLGNDNLGDSEGDTFWSAARLILQETYALLRAYVPGQPGGVAAFVVKPYVRDWKLVDFPNNWRRLAESVGFVTLCEIRAWLTEDNGTQLAMDGNHRRHFKKRSSFFRHLSEDSARAKVYWEAVSPDEQRVYLIQAADKPNGSKPSPAKLLKAAQKLAYVEAHKPAIEIDTEISYETVWIMVKPDTLL